MSKQNTAEIDAFVRDEYLPKIESQIIANNAILARIEGKGKYMADSGENIRTGARYAHLPGGFYARGAKFSTTQKETVKEFIHDWKIFGYSTSAVFPKPSLINGEHLRWQPSTSKAMACAVAETEREGSCYI